MPLPGTTGIVKHKLLPEKVFGGKKRGKKSADAASLPICTAYVVGYPSHFKIKKIVVIIINRLEDNLTTKIGLFVPCSAFNICRAAPPIPKMPKILEECN